MFDVHGLRCNHQTSALTVGPDAPWLTWRLRSDSRGVRQASYRLKVASSPELLDRAPDVFDTGVVASSAQGVGYPGPALSSFSDYHWAVEVTTAGGEQATSSPASFETGPLHPADWVASWICLPRPHDYHDDHRPCPSLRREVVASVAPLRARLYITAAGLYEAYLNGTRIGEDELTPGWTDYHTRLHYQGYDVTAGLGPGKNVIGVVLADGWYSGAVGPGARRGHYGHLPALLAQLMLTWPDGTRTVVVSDERWQAAFGPVLAADLLMGVVHDARLDLGEWTKPSFDAAGWSSAFLTYGPTGRLTGQPGPPVRRVGEVPARTVSEPVAGSVVFDLGQNMVGTVRLKLAAAAGTIVRVRHGEGLAADGTLYTENLRGARATDTYLACGDPEETFEPHFTFHGFRYAEVTGLGSRPEPGDLVGVVLSSAADRTGEFSCSDELLNQLQRNIRWGQLGNSIEVPTDCPQRDERLGWLADAQIFAPTACFNADVAAFFGKWLCDVADAQLADGVFTDVAPLIPLDPAVPVPPASPGWGDAGVIVPWVVYQWYGDERVLRRMFGPGQAWVDRIQAANPDLIWRTERGSDYGDWLPIEADTPKDLVATAYFARSASLLARSAAALGLAGQAERYATLAEAIAAAFRAEFVRPDGRLKVETQTGYLLALAFGLLGTDQRAGAAAGLVGDIRARGTRLSTGFLGVGHLLPVLTDIGELELAYQLALSEEFPSWGYSIRRGATTMWERWDGWTDQKGFQTPFLNSFNHYAFGAVGEWLYAVVGGLRCDPAGPGWARVIVEPRPGGGVRWAKCSYDSIRGRVGSSWRLRGERFCLEVELPAGVSGQVRLPWSGGRVVTESGRPAAGKPSGADQWAVSIGSGCYRFEVA
jgi:alpha-L-rhamnosidase